MIEMKIITCNPEITQIKTNDKQLIGILKKHKLFKFEKDSTRYSYFNFHGSIGRANLKVREIIINDILKLKSEVKL